MGAALPGRPGEPALSALTPPGPEFRRLFDEFEHTAYRLELRDTYNAPGEREQLDRFARDGVVDNSFRTAWLDRLARSRQAGQIWSRVRVVSVPLTPYSDWGIRIAEASNAAGDDIRYLRREDAGDLPALDYWLFDSRQLVRMH